MNTQRMPPKIERRELIAIARIVPQNEIDNHNSKYGEGAHERGSNILSNTTGTKVYSILTYDLSQSEILSRLSDTVKVKISIALESGCTDQAKGRHGEVLEELPWKE